MNTRQLVKDLGKIVGSEYVSAGMPEKIMYLMSASDPNLHIQPVEGLTCYPDVVVVPSTVEEVSAIVKLANKRKVPVLPSGQRTTSFGCANSLKGGIVVDMSFMDRVLEINEDYMVATVEGGCISNRLFYELDQRGLMFPIRTWFDPQMTIGAYISTNGHGDYSTMYGTAGENAVGLELVLPTGEIVTVGSGAYPKGFGHWHRFPCGPDLVGLQVGSAGTLGIITKAAVRILEKPKHVLHMTFGWKRDQAVELGQAMRKLHVYDGCSVWNLHLCNYKAYLGIYLPMPKVVPHIADNMEFILFIDEKGVSDEELIHKEKRIAEICESCGGVNLGREPNEIMANPPLAPIHHEYGEAMNFVTKRRADRGLQSKQFTYTYWHLPAVKFHVFYDAFEETLREFGKWDKTGGIFMWSHPPGVIAIYGGWFYDAFDPEEIEINRRMWDSINNKMAAAGANPYCIGQNFPEACKTNQGPAYDLMKKIKKSLDPRDILNPGQL
jgi:FAD/FMN-containing dehydrogenase